MVDWHVPDALRPVSDLCHCARTFSYNSRRNHRSYIFLLNLLLSVQEFVDYAKSYGKEYVTVCHSIGTFFILKAESHISRFLFPLESGFVREKKLPIIGPKIIIPWVSVLCIGYADCLLFACCEHWRFVPCHSQCKRRGSRFFFVNITGAGSPVKDSTATEGEEAGVTTTVSVDSVATEMADIDLSEGSEGDPI
jgi:hypothetical protein